MDSDFMSEVAAGLAARGVRVARFEFAYMARRRSGQRPPPDRLPALCERFRAAVARMGGPKDLVIGGKSMGGRIASMLADELGVRGVLCLGYPFHPPGRPEQTRTEHLADLRTPCRIIQGTRDPFGTREEVARYRLSSRIELTWIEDGDHDLAPRRRQGFDPAAAREQLLEAAADFVRGA
jgi:predicted alpha/beta-hydrolase family hydrolase